eukprot:m51a1_g2832 putative pas domain-containing protein tyrosine kinase (1290) ;mRNA; f:233750-237690
MHLCAQCLALALLGALAGAAPCAPEPVVTAAAPQLVVGITSSSGSTTGTNSRQGLVAALSDASEVSRVQFVPAWLDDHGDARSSANNTHELVCNGNAFLIAASVGSATSAAVLGALRGLEGATGTRVPFFGALTSSPDLRDPLLIVGKDGRTGVVNVRSEALDEMTAIVSFLSRDVDTLRSIAMVVPPNTYAFNSADFLGRALDSLGLKPWAILNVTDAQDAKTIVSNLLKTPASTGSSTQWKRAQYPAAVIVASTGAKTPDIIAEVVAAVPTGVTFVCGSNPGPTDIFSRLGAATRSAMAKTKSQIWFQQHVPNPNSTAALVSEFWASIGKRTSARSVDRDTLEGYIVGRLIAMAATRSLEIYGWPLTRQRFLDTVYRSYRTFDLRGVTFGPYGDGVAPQSPEDVCNHGIHEIFMSRMDLDTGALVEEPSSSFRFAGCNVPSWSKSERAVVGYSLTEVGEQSVLDGAVRLGLSAALMASNMRRSKNDHMIMAANFRGQNTTENVRRIADSMSLAVVALSSGAVDQAVGVARQEGKPVLAPLSGSSKLRFPFKDNKDVINIVPLMQQEMLVALQFIFSKAPATRKIGLVNHDTDLGNEYLNSLNEAIEHFDKRKLSQRDVLRSEFSDEVTDASVATVLEADAYVFAGKPRAAAQYLRVLYQNNSTRAKMKIMCAEVLQDLLVAALADAKIPAKVMENVYLLSNTPPLAMLSKTNTARQQYEQWVSEVDRGESSFRGFFVGLFLNAVIDSIDNSATETGSTDTLTPEKLVAAVYKKKVFDVGRLTVGPFNNEYKRGGQHYCNQGLDKVYIIKWQSGEFSFVPFETNDSKCGQLFDPNPSIYDDHPSTNGDNLLGLTVGLSVGLGVAAALILVLGVTMFFYSRRTLSFLNIKRPDLEINECIGKGRRGPLHVGDWHGTTVAIRVIDKKEVSKGDLATIKEEIGLLHKLHHPNLLMLMGYCETRKELFVVSEYMSGGSLKEYLARNRGQLGVFSLIAMAFDVVKGIAYLHASKPPIVHGSISTRSLLVDDKLTTKVSDFWFSRTGAKRHTHTPSLSNSRAVRNQEWLAPEVSTGLLTPATDVWAFGIVLWELFQSNSKQEAPAATLASAASGPVSASKSSSSSVPMSVQVAQHPEPDASTPKEVVELLYQCWEPQPDQRPTIFTVLRSWPSTFAAVGRFELPSDLSQVQITDDSRTSGTGPDAVVPVAMMSHSEQDTIQSLHFEFQTPSEVGGSSVISMPSALVAASLPSPGSSTLPGIPAQSFGFLSSPVAAPPSPANPSLSKLDSVVSKV